MDHSAAAASRRTSSPSAAAPLGIAFLRVSPFSAAFSRRVVSLVNHSAAAVSICSNSV